ncbi:hypothetical protein MPTK1_8g11590 [Marchantia polymorpha subsp. ruderalis]|uniref:Uncharacterized protein n=1 Tax=Marchantia polymorpha TaxID=3197 RepID=A0A2R6XMD4_MARPO|nr:hypothetical protein MARPO_0008s0057 [Marchantia polymorpha]BBN19547.1 hypothetical protein Mp_8g11590 [Marchantia polymorpha subsp. ruderalis]|eukprot:PTQ47277.1 hypothetical protein MARPO_0008s0057 [Marchantia polymorpha]
MPSCKTVPRVKLISSTSQATCLSGVPYASTARDQTSRHTVADRDRQSARVASALAVFGRPRTGPALCPGSGSPFISRQWK